MHESPCGRRGIIDTSNRHTTATAVAWVLVAAWAVFIFVASAKSGLEYDLGQGLLAQMKQWLERVLSSIAGQRVDPSPIGHFAEYFVFGALLLNALRRTVPLPRAPWLAIAIAAAYAVTDELHQLFVPGRSCDPADWVVDVIAASIAVAAMYGIACKRQR